MNTRYRLIFRGIRGGMYYCVDKTTGKRTSLKTTNKDEAEQIVEAKNTATRQPVLNLQIAKAYKDLDISEKIWPFSRTTGYRLIKSCMKAACIDGAMASPKGLRHGFAVACIQKGIPLTVIKTWMGHARLETTAIYLNVTGQEERTLAKRLWKRD